MAAHWMRDGGVRDAASPFFHRGVSEHAWRLIRIAAALLSVCRYDLLRVSAALRLLHFIRFLRPLLSAVIRWRSRSSALALAAAARKIAAAHRNAGSDGPSWTAASARTARTAFLACVWSTFADLPRRSFARLWTHAPADAGLPTRTAATALAQPDSPATGE